MSVASHEFTRNEKYGKVRTVTQTFIEIELNDEEFEGLLRYVNGASGPKESILYGIKVSLDSADRMKIEGRPYKVSLGEEDFLMLSKVVARQLGIFNAVKTKLEDTISPSCEETVQPTSNRVQSFGDGLISNPSATKVRIDLLEKHVQEIKVAIGTINQGFDQVKQLFAQASQQGDLESWNRLQKDLGNAKTKVDADPDAQLRKDLECLEQ